MLKKSDFHKTLRVFIQATLIQTLDRNVEVEQRYSKMEISMKENGIAINVLEKENFGIKTVISMRDIGKMERLKVMDFTKHKVEVVFLETGITIYNMGMAKKLGQTDRSMKENTTRALSKEKVSTNTWMAPSMKEIGIKTKYKVLEHILGLMVKSTQVNGKRITCMVKVSSAGLMADNTRVNT